MIYTASWEDLERNEVTHHPFGVSTDSEACNYVSGWHSVSFVGKTIVRDEIGNIVTEFCFRTRLAR